jgi:diguanylate cyclase (GGDEF)-like protein
MFVAVATLVIGLSASVAGGALWGASQRAQELQTFGTTASDVTANLDSLLRRDADFVATLRAAETIQPHMSATQFSVWFTDLQGRERLAGGLGATVVEQVPASQLARFRARRNLDPAFRALVGGSPARLVLAGPGPYCLLSAGSSVGQLAGEVTRVVQEDWCSPRSAIGSAQAPLLRAETETGQLLVTAANTRTTHTIIFQTAYYRQGASLASPFQRRTAVAGWIVASFDIPTLMRSAVAGHQGLAVALYHSNPGVPAQLIGRVGESAATGALARTRTLQIEGLWSVRVSGSPIARGLSPDEEGLLAAILGSLVTLLLFALILVLTRSRERAFEMVHQKTSELRHQALHDALTGLPNRVLAIDRAEQMLAQARRRQGAVTALYVDIDGFKHVNDSFGHGVGDELLARVAGRLLTVLREGDTAARLGGDEFVVLLDGPISRSGAERVTQRLVKTLREPYDLRHTLGRKLTVTASVGIAVGAPASADELLRNADVALYEAKARGRDGYAMFEPGMEGSARERMTLEMDLSEALEYGQLFLVYQPIVDLDSGEPIGLEALLRWRHPTHGVVSPEEFIPIAENSGLIVEIGRWVLEAACRQAALWHLHGHRIGISVNVSARQLESDQLIDDVRQVLRESGLEASALTLEITETTLMRDAEATAERLRSLKELGVLIAIDDFGTGYSSLAYLRQFPADSLKIDRSFINPIATSESSAAFIRTVVALARSLGIEILAEGIESQAQLETLRDERCDYGQGFLFSRPLAVEAVESFLDVAEAAGGRAPLVGLHGHVAGVS